MPASANLVLRNFGLALFLARVGIDSGSPFVDQVRHSGFAFVLAGMIVLLIVVAIVLLVGYFLLKIKFDELLGIRCRRDWEPGNPRLWQFPSPYWQARHQLRHGFSWSWHDREDYRGPGPGRGLRDRSALTEKMHECE
jgi:hypothetical protein